MSHHPQDLSTYSGDPQLTSDQIHIWLACPDSCKTPDLIATYLTWLDEQEKTRYSRFKFTQHRHTYLVAHALLRCCLSQYGSIHPAALKFSKNQYGRPELMAPECFKRFRFSLSHTHGIVTCAVTQDRDIGIDAEQIQKKVDIWTIAKTSFASDELTGLRQCPSEAQRIYFFNHWTLKEAYAKAIGMGLYIPFQEFAFHLKSGTENSIYFRAPANSSETEVWRFAVLGPTDNHRIALAVNSPETLAVIVREIVPGISQHNIRPQLIASQGLVFPPVGRLGQT